MQIKTVGCGQVDREANVAVSAFRFQVSELGVDRPVWTVSSPLSASICGFLSLFPDLEQRHRPLRARGWVRS